MATKKKMAGKRGKEGTLAGFTIIEVVLVLAIAGLIFLMVFVALPAMQRSQRDTQRRDDIGRLNSAIVQYQANNNGKLPVNGSALVTTFVANYMDNDFNDPSTGSVYTVSVGSGAANPVLATGTAAGTIKIMQSAKCGDVENVTVKSNGARNYAIMAKMENGYYCVDNN